MLGVGLLLTFVVILYEVACKRHPSHHYQNYRYRLLPRPGQLWHCNLPVNHFTNFIFCLAKLGIIVSYFYICDRTNFFMKENKYFTPINFWLPVLYITVRVQQLMSKTQSIISGRGSFLHGGVILHQHHAQGPD